VPNDPSPTPGSQLPVPFVIAAVAIVSFLLGGIIGYLLHGWFRP
jgi:hypothetical protein